MKRMSIFLWLLLPMLIAVLLLPPISFYVFRSEAEKQARTQAENDLIALQTEVASLAAETLPETVTPKGNRIQPFLRSVSSVISQTGGSARLLMYADGNHLIYPTEGEATDVETLSGVVAGLLDHSETETVLEIECEAETYLIYVSPSPVETKRLTYLVTYCPVAMIGTWVSTAGRTVLLLSVGVSVLFALLVLMMAHRLTRSLRTVEQTAEQISRKNFITAEKTFPTKELESLRHSINAMSEQLKHADRKEKTFFQNISHELRTPLMSIGGYAQGIEQDVFPDAKDAARVILSESERLTDMVNELLKLSKLDKQEESPILSPIALHALIEPAMDRIAGVALKAKVNLFWKDETSDALLTTDENRIGLIFDNLLSNAVRYAKSSVTIRTSVRDNLIVLTVEDDGEGISEEDLPHIFDRCYIGKGGHNGVGLALAKATAESIGAEMTAQNGPSGAIFRLKVK